MWCQYRHLWPGGVNWVGCRQKLPLTTDSGSVFTVHSRMVSITRWEMTHTLDLCLGPSTAMGSLNNSCLILASQNPSSARERKIRQGGNQNRDWGRHIRLAQSKSSGYKTLLTSPVVTGITWSKYDILTAHSLKGRASCLMYIRRKCNIISSNLWYTLHLADQSTDCSWKEIKSTEKVAPKSNVPQYTPNRPKYDGSFFISILYLPCLAKAPL